MSSFYGNASVSDEESSIQIDPELEIEGAAADAKAAGQAISELRTHLENTVLSERVRDTEDIVL